MKPRLFTLTLVLALAGSPLVAQPSDAAKEAIDGLKGAFKEKIPTDITHFVGKCAEVWEEADDKQKGEIQKLAKRGLKNRDRDVRVAFVEATTKMKGGKKDKWGTKSNDLFAALLKFKPTQKDIDFMDRVVRGVGVIANKKGVPILTKLLKYKDYSIVAAAGEALGGYKDADIKIKKEAVKEILKIYGSIANQAREPRNTTAQKRLRIIQKSMELGLKTLTGQNIVGAFNWQRWWNNTGKKARTWETAGN